MLSRQVFLLSPKTSFISFKSNFCIYFFTDKFQHMISESSFMNEHYFETFHVSKSVSIVLNSTTKSNLVVSYGTIPIKENVLLYKFATGSSPRISIFLSKCYFSCKALKNVFQVKFKLYMRRH